MLSLRLFLVSSLVVLVSSCGGPAQEASSPVPSAAPPAEPTPSAAGSDTPVAGATPSATPSAAPSATPATEPTRAPATLDGAIAGKPFHAVAACVAGIGKDKGKAYLEIYDVKDFEVKKSCGMLPPTPGARKIGVVLPWADGSKTDVATIKGGKEPELFVMASTDNPKKFDRKDTQKDFKPKGTIEVLRAPTSKGGVGRIKLDITAGKDKLAGEVDVDILADVTML